MKEFLIGVLIATMLVLGVSPVYARSIEGYTAEAMAQCTHYESEEVSATDSNTTVTFGKTTKAIYVENIGDTNEVYIDVNDGTATVGTGEEILLEAGRNQSLAGFKTIAIGVVCDSAETTTVLVEGCY